ncbi:14784_t:CDS:2, partial [Racocetra persica]
EWRRKANTTVAIKLLKVADGMTSLKLSNEIKCNLEHNSLFINRVYGVTKEPSTQEYAVVIQFQEHGNLRDLMREFPFINEEHGSQLAIKICSRVRPTIPDYVPKQYKEIMERCWEHDQEDRPTATELSELFYDLYKILKGEYPPYNRELSKSDVEKEFSIEKEEKWKQQLAKESSLPLKKTQLLYTSKRIDFFKTLSQHFSQKLRPNNNGK